jgi:hypothetical protein
MGSPELPDGYGPRPHDGELGRIFAYAHRTTLCLAPPEIGDETSTPVRVRPLAKEAQNNHDHTRWQQAHIRKCEPAMPDNTAPARNPDHRMRQSGRGRDGNPRCGGEMAPYSAQRTCHERETHRPCSDSRNGSKPFQLSLIEPQACSFSCGFDVEMRTLWAFRRP